MRSESESQETASSFGETVGETAYKRMRADILFARLRPGEKLKLDRVSQMYGTSVTTMRELLSRLRADGLIVAEGQRGFEVSPVSPDDFREVAAMRLLLETHAVEQSFAAGDLDWEGRVVAAHHKLNVIEKRLIAGEPAAPELWKRCDWEFHHALVSACGSKVMLHTHAAIYDKYLRYQMVAVIFRGEVAAREHEKLLECALARDAATACDVLVTHIQSCVDYALSGDISAWHRRPGADRAGAAAKSQAARAARASTPPASCAPEKVRRPRRRAEGR
jgi:DNA-binding GntR family transcriptional regulator